MRRASRVTKGRSSSGASARFSQPKRSALSASRSSQPRISSSARPRPTRRGRRCVPVPPGRMPSATSGWLITVRPRAPKRMSQRHRELAAAAADAPADLRDHRLRHAAEALAHGVERVVVHLRGALGGRVDRELEDRLDVEMRDPEVRVVAAQHHGAHRVVGGDLEREAREVAEERQRHHVERRVREVAKATPSSMSSGGVRTRTASRSSEPGRRCYHDACREQAPHPLPGLGPGVPRAAAALRPPARRARAPAPLPRRGRAPRAPRRAGTRDRRGRASRRRPALRRRVRARREAALRESHRRERVEQRRAAAELRDRALRERSASARLRPSRPSVHATAFWTSGRSGASRSASRRAASARARSPC